MPDSDEKHEFDGVARSIAALFSEQDDERVENLPAEGPAPEDLTRQGVASGTEIEAEPDTRVDPDALASALDSFLATPELERGGQSTEIRELVTALREANELDPLPNAAACVTACSRRPGWASSSLANHRTCMEESCEACTVVLGLLGLPRGSPNCGPRQPQNRTPEPAGAAVHSRCPGWQHVLAVRKARSERRDETHD